MNKCAKVWAALILALFVLGGCVPYGEEDSRLQVMTPLEYRNALNFQLMPVLQKNQTLILRHQSLLGSHISADEEIVQVEEAISLTKQAIRVVEGIVPPDSHLEHRKQTVRELESMKESFENYREAIIDGDEQALKYEIEKLKAKHASLQTMFGVLRSEKKV